MYEPRDEHTSGHVSASEARTGFANLVNRAAIKGERVRLMRHGRAIAAIVPIGDVDRLEALDATLGNEDAQSPSDDPGERAVRLLRSYRGGIAMTTDEIMALTRGE